MPGYEHSSFTGLEPDGADLEMILATFAGQTHVDPIWTTYVTETRE